MFCSFQSHDIYCYLFFSFVVRNLNYVYELVLVAMEGYIVHEKKVEE